MRLLYQIISRGGLKMIFDKNCIMLIKLPQSVFVGLNYQMAAFGVETIKTIARTFRYSLYRHIKGQEDNKFELIIIKHFSLNAGRRQCYLS